MKLTKILILTLCFLNAVSCTGVHDARLATSSCSGVRELSFRTLKGGTAKATSIWDNTYTASRGFAQPEYSWHVVAGAKLPQAIWYEFPEALRVVQFAFQARPDPLYTPTQGTSSYGFWGSNDIDCSNTEFQVILVEDNSGTPFTTMNTPKVEYVKNLHSYRCYGFNIKANPSNANYGMSNIRFWYDKDHSWSEKTLGCITSHNDKIVNTPTFEVCKEKCEAETDFLCRSIDYWAKTGECDLSTAISTSASYIEPCGSYYKENIYVERIFEHSWREKTLGCISSHNDKIVKTPTFEACKEKCEKETDFLCRSIDYLPSTGECDLSTAISTSASYIEPCGSRHKGNLYTERIFDVPEQNVCSVATSSCSDVREVSFRTLKGGKAKATSIWDNTYIASRGFAQPGYTWHVASGAKLPQSIWYEFPEALRVVQFSFQARTDAAHLAPTEGTSRYEFWGSNAADCSKIETQVILVEDDSDTPFTTLNTPKVEYVENLHSYRCYGFNIKADPSNANYGMSNIRFWYDKENIMMNKKPAKNVEINMSIRDGPQSFKMEDLQSITAAGPEVCEDHADNCEVYLKVCSHYKVRAICPKTCGACIAAHFTGPYDKIWNNNECAHIKNHRHKSLSECKAICSNTATCTAINYNKEDLRGCVLRACSLPVPQPQWNYPRYKGYVVRKSICPGGSVKGYHENNGNCFYFSKDGGSSIASWAQARKNCKDLGTQFKRVGDLAEMGSGGNTVSDEWLMETITTKGERVWLGAHDQAKNGNWVWARTGRKLSINFPCWHQNEPNNIDYNEWCLDTLLGGKRMYLNDESCQDTKHFVCQFF